jgi:hypothetical protein
VTATTPHLGLARPPAAAGSERALRLCPAPPLDGPFDDEREHVPPPVDGTLALAFPPPVRVGVPLRLVPPAGQATPSAPPNRRELLPDPRPLTARLAQAIAEVLAGARAPGQLADVASLDVLRLLERGAGRLSARTGGPRRRPVVRSVRVSEPCDGVAEGCAVLDTGIRHRVLALRLEEVRGRWRCTALQVG